MTPRNMARALFIGLVLAMFGHWVEAQWLTRVSALGIFGVLVGTGVRALWGKREDLGFTLTLCSQAPIEAPDDTWDKPVKTYRIDRIGDMK